MSKKEKAKEFWGKHKKKIILGGVLAAVGITAVVVGSKKKSEKHESVAGLIEDNTWVANREKMDQRIAALDWKVGTMDDLWDEDDYTNAIINDINVSDIGLLGDEFCKIEGVSPDSNVTMMIGVETKI